MREPKTIGGIQIRRLSRMTDHQLLELGKFCMRLYRERLAEARRRRQIEAPALRKRGMTLQDIADRFGVTRQRVSQIVSDAETIERRNANARAIGQRYGLKPIVDDGAKA